MTDTGKEIIFEERRILKSKEVRIVFVDAENNYNVISEEGDLKYVGMIIEKEPHMDDYCTCQSFMHGNIERWTSSHGYAFQCKHLTAARLQRYSSHPDLDLLLDKVDEVTKSLS